MATKNKRMMIAAAKPRGMRMGRPAPYSLTMRMAIRKRNTASRMLKNAVYAAIWA
jgi:hypothetical protein